MAHRRLRCYNTRDVYPGGRHDNDLCMVMRAGNRIFMRGQTGLDLDHTLVDPHDPAAQADQAMRNVRVLLEEAGARMSDICKLIVYITDRAHRVPVYQAMAPHLEGLAPARTGLIVKGLAMADLKMEVDVEAVVEDPAAPHRHLHRFDLDGWIGQSLGGEASRAVVAGSEVFVMGQIGAPPDSAEPVGVGHTPQAAAEQADQAMRNVLALLDDAGATPADICKMRVYISDRAFREPVYQVLGRHLGDARPCSTGLIMSGFAREDILFEIDVAATVPGAGPHRLIRPFESADWYGADQDLRCRFAMGKVAGDRIYLRGQTGSTLDGEFVGLGDPAEQARQAMRNVEQLLGEAGFTLDDVCQVTTFISDRAYREPIYRAVGSHLRGVNPVGTGIIVDGFAKPEINVELDVEAVRQ